MTAPQETQDLDEATFALRVRGRSFSAISRELGLGSAPLATEAFNRALRLRPAEEQQTLRIEEHARLDRLAEKTQADESLTPEIITRRLAVIDRMREALDAE